MSRKINGLIILIAIVLSCSSNKFGWKDETGSETGNERTTGFIEDFDPLTLNDDDIVVPADREDASDEGIQRGETEKITPVDERSTDEMVQGFRVQLMATGDGEQAREERRSAVFNFQEHVYLIFEAPLYKIRVGDCLNRREAEALRSEAIRKGFRDAWIVPSKVYPKTDRDSNHP